MTMKKSIIIHTEPCDPHTPVIVRNKYGLQFCKYGEIGEGAYFLEHELADALKSYIPHTDTDRINLLEKLNYEVKRLKSGYYILDDDNEEVFPDVFFDTWREAMDAVIDLHNHI